VSGLGTPRAEKCTAFGILGRRAAVGLVLSVSSNGSSPGDESALVQVACGASRALRWQRNGLTGTVALVASIAWAWAALCSGTRCRHIRPWPSHVAASLLLELLAEEPAATFPYSVGLNRSTCSTCIPPWPNLRLTTLFRLCTTVVCPTPL
jgi:hypothetical protein